MGTPPADPTSEAWGWAAQFGGVNNATGSLYHWEERIPAMPSSLAGTVTVYISVRVYIHTTDLNPNDHLYVELWDKTNAKIGTAQLDINNLSQANGTWQTYTFDVSSIAPEALGAGGLQGRDRQRRAHHLLRRQRVPDGAASDPLLQRQELGGHEDQPLSRCVQDVHPGTGRSSEEQHGHAVHRHRHGSLRRKSAGGSTRSTT